MRILLFAGLGFGLSLVLGFWFGLVIGSGRALRTGNAGELWRGLGIGALTGCITGLVMSCAAAIIGFVTG